MELELPAPYVARSYRGPEDHPVFALVLGEHREHIGDPEMVTVAELDIAYAHLVNCDPAADIAIIETDDGEPVGYVRTSWEDDGEGCRNCVVFAPTRPAHIAEPLFLAVVAAQEAHMRPWASGYNRARYKAFAPHPGPGQPAISEAAWLESVGYTPIRFGASLVRSHLDDIPDRQLPAGVEVRPVTPDQIWTIWEAHWEAFRGSWDFREATEDDFAQFRDDPALDTSLWKIAWAGDTVVGQVKTHVNAEENEARGYLRGYTEEISTHADWRNRGIAGALLAMSLRELRDRGYQEAALGVDTENPGGAFQLYTSVGFELRSYEAVYAKPIA